MGRESRRKAPAVAGTPPPEGPMPLPPPTEKDQARRAVQQLDAVTAKMNMSRETHAACQAAAQFLLGFIDKA